MWFSAVFIQNAFYVCPENTSWPNLEVNKGSIPVNRWLIPETAKYPSELICLALPRWALHADFFPLRLC